jgi:hypothetical protein
MPVFFMVFFGKSFVGNDRLHDGGNILKMPLAERSLKIKNPDFW